MSLLWLLFYFLVLLVLYLAYMCWPFMISTFSKQGIPVCGKPLPLFGTLLPIIKHGIVQAKMGYLEKYGKTYGSFMSRKPVLNTVDFDIIREVFIKNTSAFPYRNDIKIGDPTNDLMLNNMVDYDHWKFLRSLMSPTFSSGKLKRMMPQINRCASQMLSHLANQSKDGKALEIKEFAGSYSMDVIASTAFGLDINTKDDINNPFVRHAKGAFDISFKNPIFILLFFFPFMVPFCKYLNVTIFEKKITDFFANITDQILDSRKEDSDGSNKVDFIGLMMNSHKELQSEDKTQSIKRGMTRQEIVSQAILFFLAGYDTTAIAISFLAYNLACNPDEQQKLIEEIRSVVGGSAAGENDDDNDFEVRDEDLHNMPYLDQCINESLRLHPPAIRIDREAKHDVTVKGIRISAGMMVSVPVYHMHHYEEYYPQPEKFMPERYYI